MYSLDVNFLNDRPEYKPEAAARTPRAGAVGVPESKTPLILGLVAMLALLGISGGAWWWLQTANADLAARSGVLDSELGNLKNLEAELTAAQTQVKQAQEETAALASVFNTVKPWSAMMKDLGERTPSAVQILQVKQVPPAPNQAPAPGANGNIPPQIGTIEISGKARSFNDVNDFLLVLQRSKFLKADETRLISSKLGEPTALEGLKLEGVSQAQIPDQDKPVIPADVDFKIQTALNDVPASELQRELERAGAVGLTTRIESLRQKEVIQP
ncbi:PilN domain-containing protein [Pantanalinema rosaneae CENA516]|uniref:PilN domain-containing protein n=1 Tax=Pantanalinema rosaneae TaxID=1620701 RepID=UPI003D6F176B